MLKSNKNDLESKSEISNDYVQVHYFPKNINLIFKRPVVISKTSNKELLEYLCVEQIPQIIATPLNDEFNKKISRKNEFASIVSSEFFYSGIKTDKQTMFENADIIKEGYVIINTLFNKVLFEAFKRNILDYNSWKMDLLNLRIDYFIQTEIPKIRNNRENIKKKCFKGIK